MGEWRPPYEQYLHVLDERDRLAARIEHLEGLLRLAINDYDRRRRTWRGRFLMYLLRRC